LVLYPNVVSRGNNTSGQWQEQRVGFGWENASFLHPNFDGGDERTADNVL
jgi:hypothetical protein